MNNKSVTEQPSSGQWKYGLFTRPESLSYIYKLKNEIFFKIKTFFFFLKNKENVFVLSVILNLFKIRKKKIFIIKFIF
jgi:hypothetical protein